MTNIFSELKNMNHQLSNALSTIFLRSLDNFLHFDTHDFEGAQKALSCMIPIYQPGFLTQNVDFIRSDKASYDDIRHGFGTPKGHTFSL